MTVSRRLLRGVLGAAAATVWLALLGLVTTPYLLLQLGPARYGVFALVAVVSSHLSNLELGFGHATVRYLARARARNDPDAERGVLGSSFTAFAAAGVLGGGLMLASAPFLTSSFFRLPAGLHGEALASFRWGALILACSFLSNFFASSLQGLGRMGWLNASRTALGTFAALSAVTVVAAGGTLPAVFAAQAVVSLVSCLILGLAVARSTGYPVWPRLHRQTLREMAPYAALAFAAGLGYQWMINGPPVVLGHQVLASEIPNFSIPHTVLQKLTVLVASASVAFLPFASAASTQSDRGSLVVMFQSHLRFSLLTMGMIAAFLAAYADILLTAWISRDFAAGSAPSLRLLAMAGLVLALSGPPADVARGLGRPSWVVLYSFAVAALAVGLSIVLIPSYRATGAAAAFLLALVVVTIPFLFIVSARLLGEPPRALLQVLGRPALAVVLGATCLAAGRLLGPALLPAVGIGAFIAALYGGATFRWVLTAAERDTLLRTLRRA